ncbi:MAG: CYTH and CHAD domain-containing protein [Actinomycetota bacterium]|nr:CYTH and CHAD domain-containing protein [Actinomycetota bacterium]
MRGLQLSGSQIEIEAKYDAPGSLRLPPFGRLHGVDRVGDPEAMALEATYFDTPAFKLAAHGVTLRRRSGGDDPGWHLKTPLPHGARREVHRALNRSRRADPQPPVALLRLARAYLRGDQVAPVVRLKTERTRYRMYGPEGDLLADIADDRVIGQSMGAEVTLTEWREIEVELVDGNRKLVAAADRLLRRAGAVPATTTSKLARALDYRPAPPTVGPPGSAGAAVVAYLQEQVTALLAADGAVREDEPDSTHSMRVATRRLRSVLTTYRPLFDRAVTEPIRSELQWLGRLLGQARDAEVTRVHLRVAVGDLPAELVLGPVRSRLDSHLTSANRQGRERALAELEGERYFRLLDAISALVAAPPLARDAERPAAEVMPRRVALDWKRLRQRSDRAAAATGPEEHAVALHEVRKAAKRARYGAELAVPVAGRPAARFAKQMKRLQTRLGTRQDTVTTRDVLRAMGARAYLAGENGFTFGLLHGLERGRAEEAERQYHVAWQRAARKKYRRWLG